MMASEYPTNRCNGICLTGYEIGIPSAKIALPHPECEEHGSAAPCPRCRGTGHVCENHPDRAWHGVICGCDNGSDATCEHGACMCGAAGMPCLACCEPIPADGTHSIVEAFRSTQPGEAKTWR